MRRALERAPADEVLYREILVALGYKHNKAGMAELARRRPLGSLAGDAGAIEARLLEEVAAMPPAMWRLRNVRPANHPWRRLSGMARFLAAAREEGLARGLEARASSLGSMAAWLDPDGTGLIGRGRSRSTSSSRSSGGRPGNARRGSGLRCCRAPSAASWPAGLPA
jgi:hypothetical protein